MKFLIYFSLSTLDSRTRFFIYMQIINVELFTAPDKRSIKNKYVVETLLEVLQEGTSNEYL